MFLLEALESARTDLSGVVVHACNPVTGEVQAEGRAELHSELEASLGSSNPCVEKNKIKQKTQPNQTKH